MVLTCSDCSVSGICFILPFVGSFFLHLDNRFVLDEKCLNALATRQISKLGPLTCQVNDLIQVTSLLCLTFFIVDLCILIALKFIVRIGKIHLALGPVCGTLNLS